MKRFAVLWFALGLAAPVLARDAETVYVGKVAGQDVVVKGLEAFAYLRIGHELSLQKRGAGLYAECPAESSRDHDCAVPSGWWTLAGEGDRFTGTWQKTRGAASKPIALQRTSRSYDEVVLAGNRVTTGKPMRVGPVTWALKKESRSEVAMPVLLSGPDAAALARINATLAKRFDDAVLAALSSIDYEPDEKLLYADERVVAIGGITAYDGGGAHPSNSFSALTWNVRTGEPVDWESLMRPAPANPVPLARRDVFLAAVLRALVRAADKADGECLADAVEIMQCTDTACADRAAQRRQDRLADLSHASRPGRGARRLSRIGPRLPRRDRGGALARGARRAQGAIGVAATLSPRFTRAAPAASRDARPAAPPATASCRPRAAACLRGCAACAGSAWRCRSCAACCG